MTHHEQADGRPTYQGRPLVRPDEDVVDQGLGFDLGTLLDRRPVLRFLDLGAATLGLAACGAGSGSGTTAGSATATDSATPTGGQPSGDGSPRPGPPGGPGGPGGPPPAGPTS